MEILTQELLDGLLKKTRFSTFETKAKGNRGIIKGFASTYDLDEGGDRIIPGAFTQELSKFMDNPIMLFSHQLNMILGSWKMMEEQEKGLYAEGEINLKTNIGQDIYNLISDGDLKGLSIGYSVKEDAIDKVTGVRNLLKVKLWEVSIVSIPMNQNAWITGTKYFTGVDITKTIEPEFTFKFKHKEDDLKWEDVAIDMYTLVTTDNDCDFTKTYAHLDEHYIELGKKPPLADTKDMWQEDEPYIMEQVRFKGSLTSIVNLAKHWKDEDRNQSDLGDSVAEALKNITELLPQANENKEANPVTNNDEIKTLSKTIGDLSAKIAKVTNQDADLKESIASMVKDTFRKATGKELK